MRATRLASLAMVACLIGCTGLVTGGEGAGDDGDDDDDQLPPGQVDAGTTTPPVDGPIDAAPTEPEPEPEPEPEVAPLAAAIRLEEVALYQTVAVPLARDGSAVTARNAPVVEGADGMFALAFEVEAGFVPRSIEARVTIDGVLYKTQQPITSSSGAAPTGALRVKVPGTAIKIGSVFEVSLHEIAGAPAMPGSTAGARYPASGTTALGAVSANGPLKLVLVPFRYNADGSGRLPPTDAAAVTKYRNAFKAMYPVADVEVIVHAPVELSYAIASSSSWSQWLDQLGGVREADGAPSNHYYYGVSSPATSFGVFCGNGCTVGLGNVPSANNPFLFASVGVSFSGSLLIDTALHEVGHTMGRRHVGCGGPSGVDPSYPYTGGGIGVWGYDAVADELKTPSEFTDIMGYCNDQWISDYQFKAIFTRISTVNGSAPAIIGPPQTYRVGIVDAAGQVEWRRFASLPLPPDGGEVTVSLRDADGNQLDVADGHYFPYDHMAGGTLYVPIGGMLDTTALAPAGFTTVP